MTGPRSAVGNVSGNRCESDCRSRDPEFDLEFEKGCCQLQGESMCTKYWLTACPGKSVVRCTDRPAMTIAVDLGRKATKQTNKSYTVCHSNITFSTTHQIVNWTSSNIRI